jgi:hypothetical protein
MGASLNISAERTAIFGKRHTNQAALLAIFISPVNNKAIRYTLYTVPTPNKTIVKPQIIGALPKIE